MGQFDHLATVIEPRLVALAEMCLEDVREAWAAIEEVRSRRYFSLLEAIRNVCFTDADLHGTDGYGYDDLGRSKLEKLYALVFGTEAALVRVQFASGTHAITAALFGVLRPGDELAFAFGRPYDTLAPVVGLCECCTGSLAEFGVSFRGLEPVDNPSKLPDLLSVHTRAVLFQRSGGYEWRKGLQVAKIASLISAVKAKRPDVLCLVDNCYGEFVESCEPTHAGADLAMGSLIKNPGGGIAPAGGYVAGRRELVELAATRLNYPGGGSLVGGSMGGTRALLQGLFLAPRSVSEALKGAVFAARLFAEMGLEVLPAYDEERTDIIQGIKLGSPEAMEAFCAGIQKAGPINAGALPEAAPLPGYSHQVIMAGGSFVQGSSIELSADGPLREPYAVYLQGGLCFEHTALGALLAAQEMLRRGLISI